MKFDNNNLIVLEQCEFPGNIGDSCAETARYQILAAFFDHKQVVNLSAFITDKGVIRHPDSPWREDDTSGDQVAPLLAACSVFQPELADKVCGQLIANKYRTGNDKLISPGLAALMRKHKNKSFQWFFDLSIVGQALLFKLPIRWSDDKKRLELSNDSSADYLNFVNYLAYSLLKEKMTWPCRLAMKLVSKELVLQKVQDYYKPEPNSSWLINLYKEAIDVLWSRK